MNIIRKSIVLTGTAFFIACFCLATAGIVFAGNIVEDWNMVKVPAAPQLKQVTITPKTTALLLLDFNPPPCNAEKRPRCIASIPRVKKLLADARANGVAVVYSITFGSTVNDIPRDLAPAGGEPAVTAGPDKFLGTDLEKILKDKKIETVIVTGTAAHGAVLYTASGAALRGLNVILPVDGLSAEDLYPEQYTVWHLLNAPRVSTRVTATTMDLIKF